MTRPVSLVDASTLRVCRSSSSAGPGRSTTSFASSCGVDQVAVVAERDRAVGGGAERRLGVLPGAGAGGGVAAVADREVALERGERGLVEDLRDQAHVLVDQDLAAVADRDAGRLLAAVLEGVEAEVGQLGDVLARRPDAEDAAGVLRALVLGVECCGQPAVATRAGPAGLVHAAESTGGSGSAQIRRPGVAERRPETGVTHVTWAPPRGRCQRHRCLGKPSEQPTPVRPIWSDGPSRDALQLIAEGVTDLAGFGVAAISVAREDGKLEVMAVAGSDEARIELQGRRTPVDQPDGGDREGRRLGPAPVRPARAPRPERRRDLGLGPRRRRRSTTPTPGTRSTC